MDLQISRLFRHNVPGIHNLHKGRGLAESYGAPSLTATWHLKSASRVVGDKVGDKG